MFFVQLKQLKAIPANESQRNNVIEAFWRCVSFKNWVRFVKMA